MTDPLLLVNIPAQWPRVTGRGVRVLISEVQSINSHYVDEQITGSDAQADFHGSHVASIVRQVAPGCRLLSYAGTKSAIRWAAEHLDAWDVMNCSWVSTPEPEIDALIQQCADAGKIVVCAAGNDGDERGVRWPASHPATIAVGAYDLRTSHVPSYSSVGEQVDIVAPANVPFIKEDGQSIVETGTSFAAPVITGVAALYLEGGGDPRRFLEFLMTHAKDIEQPGEDDASGAGLFIFPGPSEWVGKWGAADMATPQQQQAFIQALLPAAQDGQRKHGLFASVTIAQAALESGWGQSGLSKQACNLFGIKGTGPAGSVAMPTWEVINGKRVDTTANFRKYHNYAECLADRAEILTSLSRYRDVLDAGNPEEQCKALKAGGWATDPDYATKLINIIDQYNLRQYDVQPGPFPDVPCDAWGAEDIAAAKEAGLVQGMDDGLFHMDEPLTRRQGTVMIARLARKLGVIK